MKQEMENIVLPNALNTLKSIPFHSIDTNIQGVARTYAAKDSSLSCAGIGEIFDASTDDDNKKCGK